MHEEEEEEKGRRRARGKIFHLHFEGCRKPSRKTEKAALHRKQTDFK